MAGTIPFPEYASTQRSKRRWVLRVAAALVVVAAIGYASLPWWLPTDWLSRRLVNQLAAELNRGVRMDRVRIGWVAGAVFEGITIEDRPGSSQPVLATIGRLGCDFAPLTTLLTGQVREIQIDEPTLYLAVDEDGRFNTSDLSATQGGRLPARHFLVRGLLCHVQTPSGRESIRFDRLECGLDPATGKVRFLGAVRPQRDLRAARASNERQFGIDAEITVPRLNPAVALGGQIKVEWTGLALADLPLGLIPRIPFEQVDGTTTGRVAVATEPDLQLDFNLDVTLDGVRIRRRGSPKTAQVPDARVRAAGRWDPNTDVVLLQDLDYETPGIRVAGRAEQGRPSLGIDLAEAAPMEAHLTGKVKDWQHLRQEFPALDRWAEESQTSLAGSADFKLDLDRRQREDRLALFVNAGDAACRLSRNERVLFAAGRQVPKRIQADVTVSRGQTLRIQPRLNFSLGGLTLTGGGDATLPHPLPGEPADLVRAVLNETVPSLQGDWAIQCADLQEVLAMCPALAQIEGVRDWRGPLEVKLTCTPSGQVNRLHARIAKGESGTVRFRDLVEVKAGYPLVIELGCDLPPATASHLGGLIVTVSHGPAELKLDSADAGIDYQFDFAESG